MSSLIVAFQNYTFKKGDRGHEFLVARSPTQVPPSMDVLSSRTAFTKQSGFAFSLSHFYARLALGGVQYMQAG